MPYQNPIDAPAVPPPSVAPVAPVGSPPSLDERLAPRRRPAAPSIGRQNWRNLLFLHWEVPVDAIQRRLPPGLAVDTFDGRAYVGVIPFAMRDVRPWPGPPIPGATNFAEINVRTYVHHGGRQPGVWFFSLDASNLAAVVGARIGWALPYYYARMWVDAQGEAPRYHSERLPPGRRPARFHAVPRAGKAIGSAAPGTLEFFLVERYLLYADWRRRGLGLLIDQVHHQPYPLRRATVADLSYASLFRANGLPVPDAPPHVLLSPGVDVEVFPLRRPGG